MYTRNNVRGKNSLDVLNFSILIGTGKRLMTVGMVDVWEHNLVNKISPALRPVGSEGGCWEL